MFTKCEICNKQFKKPRDLCNHIRIFHNIKISNYWYTYHKPENFDPICIICKSKNKKFLSLTKGFSSTCSDQTCKSKYMQSFKTEKTRKNNNTYLRITCKICGKEFDSILSLTSHLFGHKNTCHNGSVKSVQDYYNKYLNQMQSIICPICNVRERHFEGIIKGYAETCKSRSCIGKYGNTFVKKRENRYHRNFNDPLTCKICNIIVEGKTGLFNHISQSHDISLQDYYDQFLKKEDEGICCYCGQNTKYLNFNDGYHHICQDQNCINNLILDSKIKNGTLNTANSYSNYSIDNIFKPIHNKYKNTNYKFFYGGTDVGEFFQNVRNDLKCQKYKCNIFFYDFCITDQYNKPLLICEFQGTLFHLKESEILSRRRDRDIYGNNLLLSYRKDQLKKEIIKKRYPECHYLIIWEDDISNGIAKLENKLKDFLISSHDNDISLGYMRKNSIKDTDTKCEICNQMFRGIKGLSTHLIQRHCYNKIELQDYYDNYLLSVNKKCPVCNIYDKKFIGLTYGYTSTCLINPSCRYKWMNMNKTM